MALRKTDLYSSLWSSADELRGGMDASQYKDYVLTLLFVKYVSDKAKADPYSLITVPQGGSFDALVDMKGKAEIGDLVNKAIVKLAEANDLVGVLTNADFDDKTKLGEGKDLVDRLSNLIGIFQELDFTGSRAEGDDLLGDAYEYLMRHFATESGKSKGQFYTPAEVSRVMAQLLQIPASAAKSTTVYDPTCGSGSLLIKVADASPHGLSIYGQENDVATWSLARMNMILHGNETHDIRQGNTLSSPKLVVGDGLMKFDYVVANPPFSVKTWKNGVHNDYGRFDGYDTPPDKNGDFAFLLHIVKSLKSTGRAAVILPHGVLFRSNAEGNIRKALVKRGLIEAIIGLPPNLFYGTGIPACILILDKADAGNRKGIYMVDAAKGFVKDGPKNRLRPRDMHRIVDAHSRRVDIERYARFVPNAEIESEKNDFNLNLPRYIDSSDPQDVQDLSAHLNGGIPNRDLDALGKYWTAFPSLRSGLFAPLREGYSRLIVSKDAVAEVVSTADEYQQFLKEIAEIIAAWWSGHREALEKIGSETVPNELANRLAEDLLDRFRGHPLIDEYAIYEQFMSYWSDSMHDDVTLIVGEGWAQACRPRAARVWKDKSGKTKREDAHLQFGTGASAKRWVTDLVPPTYLVHRYFSEAADDIHALSAHAETVAASLTQLAEEHGVEEGLLWDALDSDGKLTLSSAKSRLKEAVAEASDAEETALLREVIALFAEESNTRKALRQARAELDEATLEQYSKLADIDIQSLVIHERWGKEIADRIAGEVSGLGAGLISRIRQLASRYESTIDSLTSEVESLSQRMQSHLTAMGITK